MKGTSWPDVNPLGRYTSAERMNLAPLVSVGKIVLSAELIEKATIWLGAPLSLAPARVGFEGRLDHKVAIAVGGWVGDARSFCVHVTRHRARIEDCNHPALGHRCWERPCRPRRSCPLDQRRSRHLQLGPPGHRLACCRVWSHRSCRLLRTTTQRRLRQ